MAKSKRARLLRERLSLMGAVTLLLVEPAGRCVRTRRKGEPPEYDELVVGLVVAVDVAEGAGGGRASKGRRILRVEGEKDAVHAVEHSSEGCAAPAQSDPVLRRSGSWRSRTFAESSVQYIFLLPSAVFAVSVCANVSVALALPCPLC